jgi:hypothetical protein
MGDHGGGQERLAYLLLAGGRGRVSAAADAADAVDVHRLLQLHSSEIAALDVDLKAVICRRMTAKAIAMGASDPRRRRSARSALRCLRA